MKKLRNHSQLKEQENSTEEANNETDIYSLIDTEFKRETVKVLKVLKWKYWSLNMKELRADINSNADYFRKESIRRSHEKLENSLAEMQTELKALKSRMNNAEEWISDLEDRIMEITQSGQQKKTKWKNMKEMKPVW